MPYRIIERTNIRTAEKDYIVQEKFLFWWGAIQYYTGMYYREGKFSSLEEALICKIKCEKSKNPKYTKKVVQEK